MAATRKKATSRKTTSKSRPAKKASKLIKSVITDKQVNLVKKSVATLAKDVNALDQRLKNDGAINMSDVNKIVDAAIIMQQSLADPEK